MRGNSRTDGQEPWSRRAQKGTVYNRQGQALRYWLCGETGPVMLLCNGLLSGVETWTPLVTHFHHSHRLLLWEYPGQGVSAGTTAHEKPGVQTLARDALLLLEGVGIEQAVLVGQGIGVHVVLEIFRRCPEEVLSIVGLCGALTGPLSAFVPVPLDRLAARSVKALLLPLGVPVWKVLRAVRSAYAPAQTGAREPGGPAGEPFPGRTDGWLDALCRTDPQAGFHILSSMLFYHPPPPHPRRNIPVLFMAGDRDRLASPENCRDLAGTFPGFRLEILPGCSHRALEEDPESVNRHVGSFLREHRLV